MPTADASQFTEIKRYQANINGSLGANPLKFRVPSFYGGYRANYGIGVLPPNAVVSNKTMISTTNPLPISPIIIDSTNFANEELLEPLSFSSRNEINFIFSVNLSYDFIDVRFFMSNSNDRIKTVKFTQGDISKLYELPIGSTFRLIYREDLNRYRMYIRDLDFSKDVYVTVITENPITSISNIVIQED